MRRFSIATQSSLLALALLVPVAAWASDQISTRSSVMSYAWSVTNTICGISAILVIGDIAWHARDMNEHARRVKAGFMALVLLGCLYAVAAFILSSVGN